MPPLIVALLRFLEDRPVTSVRVRADQAPVFWNGNARLDDQGEFAPTNATEIRKMIAIPLSDEQLAEFRRRSFLSVELRIKGYGAYRFEAYVMHGREEIVIARADYVAPTVNDADEQWNRAVAFLEEGECQLAWHAFEAARVMEPDDGAILFEIGKLLGHDLHRVDEAIAMLERVIALGDAPPEVHAELALMMRS